MATQPVTFGPRYNEGTTNSNRLYSGEIGDFREAMGLIIRGMAAEKREVQRWNATLLPGEEEYREEAEYLDEYAAAAKAALALYAEEVAAALKAAEARVLAKLRAMQSGNAEMEQIADALESGEYSPLAW